MWFVFVFPWWLLILSIFSWASVNFNITEILLYICLCVLLSLIKKTKASSCVIKPFVNILNYGELFWYMHVLSNDSLVFVFKCVLSLLNPIIVLSLSYLYSYYLLIFKISQYLFFEYLLCQALCLVLEIYISYSFSFFLGLIFILKCKALLNESTLDIQYCVSFLYRT